MATRPFSCLRCSQGANSRSNMESHITNMHTAVKPFACTEHGCAVTCARADWLKNHVRDAHGRDPSPREMAGDTAIKRSIRDEADLTEVAVHPRVPRAAALVASVAPAAVAAPAAPLVAASVAPSVAPPVAPPVAHVVPPANIDWDTVPGYYLYLGIPYGTGPPIPGGR